MEYVLMFACVLMKHWHCYCVLLVCRPYWRCYYSNTDAIIYVVDSRDRDRIGISKQELMTMLEVRFTCTIPIATYSATYLFSKFNMKA